MNNAIINLTKLNNSFIDPNGQQVNYQYVEIELAPGVFAKLSLKEGNMRLMQKYSPDMYQLISNIPVGQTIVFREVMPARPDSGITNVYRMQNEAENEL